MPEKTETVSSKTAASTLACIKQADDLLTEAVTENEKLASELENLSKDEERFAEKLTGCIEKLASEEMRVLGDAQKQAWLDYCDSPASRKEAATHLIDQLCGLIVSNNGGSEKTAAEIGEVADMPGTKTANEKREPIHPTARY